MRKKIGIWLLVGLLFLQPAISVCAAPDGNSEAAAISGYCLGDELYAFIRIKDGYDTASFEAKLQPDSAASAKENRPLVPITETSATVRYVFMVDLSGSMSHYAQKVNAFVDSLMETEKLPAFYTVASFGERFEIVKENLTDKNAVKKVLDELQYTEDLTDPYTGVEKALDYLDGYSIKSGDLLHLVVITDGDPELGIDDEEKSREKEERLARSATRKIGNAPEVIVSTICMAEWDKCAIQALSAGSGIHEIIDDSQDAGAAGEKMAKYVDSLYRIDYKLSVIPADERFSVKLTLLGKDAGGQATMLNVSLEGVPNLKLFSNNIQENPDKEKPDKEKPGGKDTEETKKPENEDKTGQGDKGAGGSKDIDKAAVDETARRIDIKLILIIGACAFVIVAGICAIILKGKRNSREAKSQPEAKRAEGASGGITMKLEVYSGNCVRRPKSICLTDSFVIGSAKECDIVFDDPDVSLQNSRVFVKDQVIYIEDLDSAEGTALGGMRIQSQNRLRSGDVISIGNVEFCFKF